MNGYKKFLSGAALAGTISALETMTHNAPVTRAMFVDEIDISVQAGDGGNGCMSFRRERFVAKGGPDGGDGGRGGSIYMLADESLNTLHHLAGKHHWKAKRGGGGRGKKCHGRGGEDIVIPVPPGTLIRDAEHNLLLKDLAEPGQRVCVAKGGRGGKGNTRFKTATNQAPREFEEGLPGQHRQLHLELKLIADVGLAGLPNAGKSTLVSRLSAARPKIAAYPFTTLTPTLGIVEMTGYRRFVIADIPGLIEGAHEGHGLGDEFLRHIERTKILIHLVDICQTDGTCPAENYEKIHYELEAYSPKLARKPAIIVANKMDLSDSQEHFEQFSQKIRQANPDLAGHKILAISAATGQGLDALQEEVWRMLHPPAE